MRRVAPASDNRKSLTTITPTSIFDANGVLVATRCATGLGHPSRVGQVRRAELEIYRCFTAAASASLTFSPAQAQIAGISNSSAVPRRHAFSWVVGAG